VEIARIRYRGSYEFDSTGDDESAIIKFWNFLKTSKSGVKAYLAIKIGGNCHSLAIN